MKGLLNTRTAGVIQLVQTVITIVFVITSNIPTNVLYELPIVVERLSMIGFLGACAAPVTSIITFRYLKEGKRAGEKSKWKIPIIFFAIVNMIIGVIWIGMWALVIIGALLGEIHV